MFQTRRYPLQIVFMAKHPNCHILITNRNCFFFLCSKEYISPDPPRVVLNKLEKMGYKVITATGVGQTIVWTLHKADDDPEILDKGKADR